MELLAILITWYVTKLYYTRDLEIKWVDFGDPSIVKATCFKCARTGYVTQDQLRAPYYCMSCK
jgi:hypothetical protein